MHDLSQAQRIHCSQSPGSWSCCHKTPHRLVLGGEHRVLHPKRHFEGSMDNTKRAHLVLVLSHQMLTSRVDGPSCSSPLNPHSPAPPRNLLSLGVSAASGEEKLPVKGLAA